MARPQIVFIHLPKTGGMSLHGAVAGALPEAATLRIGDEPERLAFLATPRDSVATRQFISGHLSFEDATAQARPDARFVTLLRDPVARLLSAFNYMASWSAHPLHAEMSTRSFSDFILDSGDALHAEACRQLTGTKRARDAIQVMESCYACVGLTGRVADVAGVMARWLHLKALRLARENVTPGQGRITLDSHICARLIEVTREDLLLHDHIAQAHHGLLVAPGMRG